MAGMNEDDWKSIVETSYEVTNEMIGRTKAYDQIIAKGLNIAGKYQVQNCTYKVFPWSEVILSLSLLIIFITKILYLAL